MSAYTLGARYCEECGRVLRPEAHVRCAPCIASSMRGGKPAQGIYSGPVASVPDAFDPVEAARIADEALKGMDQ